MGSFSHTSAHRGQCHMGAFQVLRSQREECSWTCCGFLCCFTEEGNVPASHLPSLWQHFSGQSNLLCILVSMYESDSQGLTTSRCWPNHVSKPRLLRMSASRPCRHTQSLLVLCAVEKESWTLSLGFLCPENCKRMCSQKIAGSWKKVVCVSTFVIAFSDLTSAPDSSGTHTYSCYETSMHQMNRIL